MTTDTKDFDPQFFYLPDGQTVPRMRFSVWLRHLENCPEARRGVEHKLPNPIVLQQVLDRYAELGRPDLKEWPEFLDLEDFNKLVIGVPASFKQSMREVKEGQASDLDVA